MLKITEYEEVIFDVVLCLGCLTIISAQQGPAIAWETQRHDFGDVVQGNKVEYTYRFKNSGATPLLITNVQVTCGCTTPKGWARDPIPPGETGELTVAFNSAGKYGKQEKVVVIQSNATNADSAEIRFSANVIEKKVPN